MVRSSAVAEDISARGLYSSVAVTFASFQTVGEAIARVWADAARLKLPEALIPVIVQARVAPMVVGHLSNESRLRRDRRDWVVELHGDIAASHSSGLRALRHDRVEPSTVELECTTPRQIRGVLRRIAGAYTRVGERVHFEWVWDGSRVWVVQCDAIEELRSSRPVAHGRPVRIPQLCSFRSPTAADIDIPKVRCVAEYVAAGLPHADLRVLRDGSTVEALSQGTCPSEVQGDLSLLADAGVVVRSDYARGQLDFEVLLPRTETEYEVARLREYLVETARVLREKKVPPEDVAFLTHAFIPADVAAWTVSAPGSPEVRIDATYGLPDGLLYYTHDSYVVNSRRGTIRSRIRCKATILVCDRDGSWRTVRLGAPWDWRSALDRSEAVTIAELSKRLADYLGRPVETMFFVRAHRLDGGSEILPWVHRTQNVGAASIQATESHFPRRSVEVRDMADLRVLRDAFESTPSGERLLVRLRPHGELLHDADFLAALIAELPGERCVVELAGSALSHVFYELQRAGVQVRTVDPLAPSKSETVSFNKLVRDSVPDLIAARGEQVSAYRADGEELSQLLRRKAIEEALEVAAAASTDELIEEVGDLLDVLEALATVAGTDLEVIRSWAGMKRIERGGFERGVVLLQTRDTSLEEALQARDYAVGSDLGVEVERARGAQRAPDRFILDRGLIIPLDVIGQSSPEPVRVVIRNEEFHLRLTAKGLELRRGGPASDNPYQMTLGF